MSNIRLSISLALFFLLVAAHTLDAQQKTLTPEPLAACSQKLISYADWPKVKNPKFSLDINTQANARLYYFGAHHSSDPTEKQFAEIEAAWNKIKPTVAFYEGPNRPIAATRDETIKQAGESGFVRFLATRDGVPFVSLEPSPQDEARYVLKSFTVEQVKLFYVLRETARLRDRRKLTEPELRTAVAQLLERASKLEGFGDSITTLE
ncbi:MAG TPA: hypothetical protein VNA19_05710, partial [Pyrinomonadaceae bacterium]|nr:hypothetical protein [Pyrinomonadaceae bacterium]